MHTRDVNQAVHVHGHCESCIAAYVKCYKEVATYEFFLQPMVTMFAIRIASALNLYPRGHLLLLLRVDAATVQEPHTSLTFLHQPSADHVVSVTCCTTSLLQVHQ